MAKAYEEQTTPRRMECPTRVQFVSQKRKDAFDKLEFGTAEEQAQHKELSAIFDLLKRNAFSGTQIPKRLIPKDFKTPNLWKFDLKNGWRLLYAIISDGDEVISILIDWMNHRDYNRKFKY